MEGAEKEKGVSGGAKTWERKEGSGRRAKKKKKKKIGSEGKATDLRETGRGKTGGSRFYGREDR